jgi:hypothetical protein
MSYFNVAVTGQFDIKLPQWGRAFWQDPSDGRLFLAFASGTSQLFFSTSANSGVSWTAPEYIAPCDDFSTHNNFDAFMDPRGHVHVGFRYNGSGCYQMLGRIPGGSWSRSSGTPIQPQGFCEATDTGEVKGFQGSITVLEAQPAFDVSVRYPLVRIAAKKTGDSISSFYLPFPHNGTFTEDYPDGPSAGVNGGFPLSFYDRSNDSYAVTYTQGESGLMVARSKFFGTWGEFGFIPPVVIPTGQTGFKTNMGIGSGSIRGMDGVAMVICPTGSTMWNTWGGSYGRTESSTTIVSATGASVNGRLPWLNWAPRDGIVGVGSGFPGSGTNCDFTFDDNANFIMYFQKKDDSYRQSIGRLLANSTTSRLQCTEVYHQPSGVRYFATVSRDSTGGYDNKLFYSNFKACKHPTAPNPSNKKKGEFVVTAGHHASYPSGGKLCVWNVKEAPSVVDEFSIPYYTMNYTATSGSSGQIFNNIVTWSNVQSVNNLFDNNTATSGGTANNGSITVALDGPRTVDRIEIVGNSTSTTQTRNNIGRIDVYGSFDNSTFNLVGSIPSGLATFGNRVRALNTDVVQVAAQPLPNTGFQQVLPAAICAKYLRFNFTTGHGAKHKPINDIRIYGPQQTVGPIYVSDDSYLTPAENQIRRFYTEKFRRQQGELPPNFHTYGDFTWTTVGSGEFTRSSSLPTFDLPEGSNGIVHSGIFNILQRSHGTDDGFSLRSEATADTRGTINPLGPIPVGGIVAGNTGVVEAYINISADEFLASDGTGGRRIGFNVRMDPHNGDRLDFYTVSSLDSSPTGTLRASWQSAMDWQFNSWELSSNSVNNYTLRWVYTRGSDTSPLALGAAWIDDVIGLDGPPISSIGGFVSSDVPYETGAIYGYLNAGYTESIKGYVYAVPFYESINAYVAAGIVPSVLTSIHAYLLPANDSYRHGYLLCSSGVTETTFPTGYINAYVMVPSGSGPATIHGFASGMFETPASIVHGYLPGTTSSLTGIYGWLHAWDGATLPNPNGPQGSIYGYLYGFAEETGSVNGYALANYPLGSIHGYLGSQALVASGGGLVGSPSTSNVPAGANITHGFLQGHDGFQYINVYVMATPGSYNHINGYVLSGGANSSINSYLAAGNVFGTGIHGWASGAGFSNLSANGYVFGVSGILTSNVLGYLVGDSGSANYIWGTLIGSPSGTPLNSKGTCVAHNFPLDVVIPVTIPTSFF